MEALAKSNSPCLHFHCDTTRIYTSILRVKPRHQHSIEHLHKQNPKSNQLTPKPANLARRSIQSINTIGERTPPFQTPLVIDYELEVQLSYPHLVTHSSEINTDLRSEGELDYTGLYS